MEITVKDLDPKAFIRAQVESIRAAVGDGAAVVALSGGVDSSVVTVLGHWALGPRLKACLIENGIMRAGEPGAIVSTFKRQHNVLAQLGIDTRKAYGYHVLDP